MLLSEIRKDDILKVESRLNEETIVFSLIVVNIKNGVVVTKLYKKGHIDIDLDDRRIQNNIFTTKDKKTVLWKNCTIRYYTEKGNPYYLLLSNGHATPYVNKRNCYRQFIGEVGTCKMKDGSTFNATVKDMSVSGFSLILKDKINENFYESVSFYDDYMKSYITFTGIIVRWEKLNNNSFLYGGIYTNININIEKFITAKQLISLRRGRGKNR
jgi:hypothetical protein